MAAVLAPVSHECERVRVRKVGRERETRESEWLSKTHKISPGSKHKGEMGGSHTKSIPMLKT